jgi:hypothetical protein
MLTSSLNNKKYAIIFRKDTKVGDKCDLMEQGIHCKGRLLTKIYISGLLVYIAKLKNNVFQYLKDKVWKRVQGWKDELLSKVGKDILIRVVAQSMYVYAMACFDLLNLYVMRSAQ